MPLPAKSEGFLDKYGGLIFVVVVGCVVYWAVIGAVKRRRCLAIPFSKAGWQAAVLPEAEVEAFRRENPNALTYAQALDLIRPTPNSEATAKALTDVRDRLAATAEPGTRILFLVTE